MTRASRALYATQIVSGIAAAAAAYAFLPRKTSVQSRPVVVVTGGSRGLGLAIAERFGRGGARLVLAARHADQLESARQLLVERGCVRSADDVLLVPGDLTAEANCKDLVDLAIGRFGAIDVLVNDAGIIEVGPVENQPIEAFQRAMDINFYAALYTIQAAMPHMLARFRERGIPSSIVNISSIGGKVAVPHLLPYVASKFALTGLSEGLHAELRHKGVRVTTVCPGLMRTGSFVEAMFTGQAREEFKWFTLGSVTPGVATTASHAADRIYGAVRRGSAEITITPQAWLAARFAGIAPAPTQFLAALVNQFILPAPADDPAPLTKGLHLRRDTSPTSLEVRNNQV